jgi:hypothetical protein
MKCTFSSTGVKSTTHPYCCVCKIWFQLFDMKKLSPDDFCTLYHRNLSILPYRVIITTCSILLLTGLCEQKLCSCSIVILVSGATTLCYSNEVLQALIWNYTLKKLLHNSSCLLHQTQILHNLNLKKPTERNIIQPNLSLNMGYLENKNTSLLHASLNIIIESTPVLQCDGWKPNSEMNWSGHC